MKTEKTYKPVSGYFILLILLFILLGVIFSFLNGIMWLGTTLIPVFILTAIGFTVVNPNESSVLILFGAYRGTIKTNGFFWVNPFLVRKKISLRARNFNSETIKVKLHYENWPGFIPMIILRIMMLRSHFGVEVTK